MDLREIRKILAVLVLSICLFLDPRALVREGFAKGYQVLKESVRTYKTLNNALNNITKDEETDSTMTYGRFLEYLDLGWVKEVDLYNNSRRAMVLVSSPELGNQPQAIRVDMPVGNSQLIQKLKESDIDFTAHPNPTKSLFLMIAGDSILSLTVIGAITFFFNNSNNPKPKNFLMNSSGTVDPSPDTAIFFDDIAGIEEAKEEFEEIVSFLKEPERYTLVGAKIPKGVLLIGPPGTGKTLLARAIANEANVPFYNVAGSEFVEMYIGMGASRIRDLFEDAYQNTPCIVFIDEIDSVGRERGAGIGGGNDEREQTLNQLLTEMDGFEDNQGIIVVGSTNRVDILDAALLRPGRFDRQIRIGLPDRLGRLGILKIHARNKPLAEDVSLVQLANRTPGFSGAELANLLNESAILAARYKKKKISKDDVNEAADRIIGGIAGSPMENTKNKKLIAYHEVGHAIIGSLLENHDDVEKITLIPRGGAKGLTWFAAKEEGGLVSYIQLLAKITTILGGRVTERVVFGDQEITTGASNDLQQVTSIARNMVTKYGMSSIGPIAIDDTDEQIFLVTGKNSLINRADSEVSKIIKHCEKTATNLILDNRVIIDLIVEKLLESETINGEEFKELLQQYTVPPVKI